MQDEKDPGTGGTVSAADRRAHRRSRVLWGATVMSDDVDGELTCTVVDISAGGAKVMMNEKMIGRDPDILCMVTPGARISLSVRASGTVPAEVVWQEGNRAGLRFLVGPADVRARFPGVVPQD